MVTASSRNLKQMSPEQREQLLANKRAYYYRHKDEILRKQKERYHTVEEFTAMAA